MNVIFVKTIRLMKPLPPRPLLSLSQDMDHIDYDPDAKPKKKKDAPTVRPVFISSIHCPFPLSLQVHSLASFLRFCSHSIFAFSRHLIISSHSQGDDMDLGSDGDYGFLDDDDDEGGGDGDDYGFGLPSF